MSITFNADEIFVMAEQIERNGVKFYLKAAKGSSDKAMKKEFQELAAMEVDHEKTFAALRAEFADREKESDIYDPNNEAQMYLQAMADGEVFDLQADPSERLTGDQTVQEILKIAMGLEKDSIVFYLGLEDLVSVKSGKDKVREIIKQEMSHITLLNEKLKALR
ncbi:MAG: ferritin family protein [Phycisphaerae bacterium]|nr:ferritin family protein [Phycisphaerae bacterium]